MESNSLDHYEQQLFKVFESHDHENKGSLDRDGLTKLCQTLQLEEQSEGLIKVLLKDPKITRITFAEFKDALLGVLDNLQNGGNTVDASPDREVSPKFVYGSKKYGRRSRCEDAAKEAEKDNNIINKSNQVQRSNSQKEVTYSKKRRLKRCTSLPGQNNEYNENHLHCTEDMLREAWKKLGVGEDGFLNQTELILVCNSIGLNKLADSVIRQLSNKVVLDYNKKISFHDLLEAIQQDETWNEFLLNTSVEAKPEIEFVESKVLQHIKLGSDGTGYINSDVIIDLWEHAGISSPKMLLTDLGFRESQINVQELSAVLEKEIKGLGELNTDHTCNPHTALLHAFLSLYQTEIKFLRNLLEQMQVEREKLKCDIFKANNRSTMLAQEVDDNVAKMEANTQKHVKLLEQRHADLVKEVTEQFLVDKKKLTEVNHNLEGKIRTLETEEARIREDLHNAQLYTKCIDAENHELLEKIDEYEQKQQILKEKICELEEDKIRIHETEAEKSQDLMLQMAELQKQNSSLRDEHDEIVSRLENLSNKSKLCGTVPVSVNLENDMEILESLALGGKRRSDDCTNDDFNSLDISCDESPRLGKVRKFHKNVFQSTKISETNESLLVESQSNEITVHELETKVKCLLRILEENSIAIPKDFHEDSMRSFEKILLEIKAKADRISDSGGSEELESLKEYIKRILLGKCDAAVAEEEQVRSESLSDLEEERNKLVEKCKDLESGLDLMKNEYEKCEDYWQCKLEDERRLFEQEQSDSTKRLNEVLTKLSEYEEQYLREEQRLPTIDEALLESQYNDLEKEFDEYRALCQLQLEEKEQCIVKLSESLTGVEVGVQCEDLGEEKHLNLSNHMIETTNLFSIDTKPFNWNNNNSSDLHSLDEAVSEKSPSSPFHVFNNNSTPLRQNRVRRHDRINAQQRVPKKSPTVVDGSTASTSGSSSGKSSRIDDPPTKWDALDDLHDVNEEPKCWVTVSALHKLQGKKQHLEERCKKLQMVLKQHQYDEQLMQYWWQQCKSDRAKLQYYLKDYQDKFEHQIRLTNELQDRLARNDLLVKDLFVNNAYLIAKNQRLEQQCYMLTQCNSNSKSV
ncbi:PREDICTED: blastoderm-specific protein 25D isoform X2 [Nicrophorus vespilloides]|nr:PREDICTED: blastoderm-specific protein 25D isoform X2 [Nicrophorus vespilloides]